LQSPLVYHKGSLFGIDIGSHSAKLAQVRRTGKGVEVMAYGHVDFAPETVVEGVVVDPDSLAKAIKPLLDGGIGGVKFTSRKIATALPIAKGFTRILQLPPMEKKDLEEAVKLEAEQSIPVPETDLYMDHEVIGTTKNDKGENHTDVLLVAAPRAIVDSYVKLFGLLDLEIVAIEVSLMAIARTLIATQPALGPTLIVDFGSESADLAIIDKVIRLTGTIAVGGDQITASLVKNLGITAEQANEIKYKFGVGPSGLQAKVMETINPLLKSLTSEITKAMKYYQDRNLGHQISNVTLTGGGASMPGMAGYLAEGLKGTNVSISNPWSNLITKHVKALDSLEAPMYATALGLALLEVMP